MSEKRRPEDTGPALEAPPYRLRLSCGCERVLGKTPIGRTVWCPYCRQWVDVAGAQRAAR